jgi:hypothetical protein
MTRMETPLRPSRTRISTAETDELKNSPPLDVEAPRRKGVTTRVAILCLALAALFAYVIPTIDYRFSNTYLGATHLPPGAVGVLLMLLVINPLIGLLSHKWKFSRNEVLTVYLSCLVSCLVPGIGGNNYFTSFIIGSFYYATPENKWFDFLQTLPHWMTPALGADGTYNRALVEGWYVGGVPVPWNAWILPLFAWGALFFATFTLQACLAVMLRAQWGQHEALAFPLLRLPLVLSEDVDRNDRYGVLGRFFRNPLTWIGIGIAVVLQAFNGLNLYFPDWPPINLGLESWRYMTEAPWNQIGWLPVRIFLIAVGITYLLSSEVSFSLWFFFWFIRAQMMLAYYLGFPPDTLPVMGSGQKIFTGYQEVGAHLMYVATVVWIGRAHFAHIARRAFSPNRVLASHGERSEALSYPLAFWGFLLSLAFLVGWTTLAGVAPLLALALWASYIVLAMMMARVVAEAGLLFVHHSWMPLGAISQLLGSGAGTLLSPANGVVPAAVIEYSCIQDYRGSLMPSFVQAFKLAHDEGIAARRLFVLLFAVILVGMIVGFRMNVQLGYEHGGLQLQKWLSLWGPQNTARNAEALSRPASDVSWANWLWLGLGGALTYGMMLARSRFVAFPFHPIGYLMCLTYPMQMLWISVFIGWLCKVLIVRFGGHDTYRKAMPLFLGLALGDVVMMLFWISIDAWQERMGHQLMPG